VWRLTAWLLPLVLVLCLLLLLVLLLLLLLLCLFDALNAPAAVDAAVDLGFG
jgi:hypothetical protein